MPMNIDYPYFPPRPSNSKWHGLTPDGKLPEIHLYDGSQCNRACEFCIVSGHPQGWYQPFNSETLDKALALVSPQGKIKFYGGEPTLHPENILTAVNYLQSQGFCGQFRLYTNGILADNLIYLLESIPEMDAVLNYSILHGRGAAPIPQVALHKLLSFPAGRIFAGHPDLVDAGIAKSPGMAAPEFAGKCPHCYPVVRSDGMIHGCPFAVEITTPLHFDLGTDDRALANFQNLIAWQTEIVETEAVRRQIHPCQVCKNHLKELPVPNAAPKSVGESKFV